MGHNSVRKGRIKQSSRNAQLRTMGDNPITFEDNPLKTVGGVVFTRICYICISNYLKKGHNSVRKGQIENTHLYAQLRTIGDIECFKIIH